MKKHKHLHLGFYKFFWRNKGILAHYFSHRYIHVAINKGIPIGIVRIVPRGEGDFPDNSNLYDLKIIFENATQKQLDFLKQVKEKGRDGESLEFPMEPDDAESWCKVLDIHLAG